MSLEEEHLAERVWSDERKGERSVEGMWPEKGPVWEAWPVYKAWPEKVETEKDRPAEGAWAEQKEPEEGVWLGKKTGSSEMLLEIEGLVEGQWLVAEDPTKEVWPRERGELEKGVKPKTLRWGAYSAERVKLMEGLMPEKWPWPRKRRIPPEKIYPDVRGELAKEVWPVERGGSAEKVEQREEGLVEGAWPMGGYGPGEGAWSVEMVGASPSRECL